VKVIFTDDVPNVARVGQTKDVANGYARNFLFPRKLAVLADSQAAAAIDAHLKKIVKQHAVEEAQMAELAKKINGLQITLRAKVGENDKLYGSITGADIAEALSKAAGCVIDKKHVALAEPIKLAGTCDVTIKFMHEITAVIKANVVDENATDEQIAAAKAERAAKAEKAKEEKAKEEKAEAKKAKAAKVEKVEEPAAEVKPEKAEKAEKPAKEKKAKAEKAPKTEKAEEKPAEAKAEVKAEKAEKPAKEKKAKAEKATKEAAPAEAKAEEKKEKKPRKAKKEEAAE
jgi:large subunit ribosomal protein L9